MSSARPPSQPPRNTAVDSARGALRDALGALGNLALLVSSVRVGSKAITGVLPDVKGSCEPMRVAADELFDALEPWPAVREARNELRRFVTDRVLELERDLEPFVEEPLKASSRLDLDRLLQRVSRDLDSAYSLMELLEVSAHEPNVVVHLPELLITRLSDPPSGRRPQRLFTARMAVRGELSEGSLKPRALAALVAAEAELYADRGEPSLVISCLGGEIGLRVSPDPAPDARELSVWGYGSIEPTMACLTGAAALTGVRVERSEGGTLLRIQSTPEIG